ncbi:MAG: hypothetical protein M0R22_11325 [Dehalococcoidia bacterium]|jgi:hypothetical protein|nr:hypothetical protein [Dehalococcoidia bacterium]
MDAKLADVGSVLAGLGTLLAEITAFTGVQAAGTPVVALTGFASGYCTPTSLVTHLTLLIGDMIQLTDSLVLTSMPSGVFASAACGQAIEIYGTLIGATASVPTGMIDPRVADRAVTLLCRLCSTSADLCRALSARGLTYLDCRTDRMCTYARRDFARAVGRADSGPFAPDQCSDRAFRDAWSTCAIATNAVASFASDWQLTAGKLLDTHTWM